MEQMPKEPNFNELCGQVVHRNFSQQDIYENNFVKKAQIKKIAKEEKEMKKRVSIKKDKVHYIDHADTQSVTPADFLLL